MSERNLYEVTGDIKDINTLLVSREEWNRRAQPAQRIIELEDKQPQADLLAAAEEFCRKVEAGEARSTKSYAALKSAIEQIEKQPQAEVGNSGFDHKTAADFLSGKTVSDEAVRKFVQASRWAHDDRASLQSTLLSVRNELASREAEIALLKKELMGVESAPQQAETVPSSDLNPDEGDPVTLWAEIWRLREAVKGPDGYATWQDAATAERIRRVRAESKQAEEAKAVPTHDDTDLIEQMLEALRSCSGVPHWPALIPTVNAARKRLETLQQAEAVPPGYALVPVAVLEAAAESLGSFVSDNGWTDLDMQAMDNIDAILAQQKGHNVNS